MTFTKSSRESSVQPAPSTKARGRSAEALEGRVSGRAEATRRARDGRAASAARYPEELCRAICRGIVKEKMERKRGIRVVGEVDLRMLSRFGFPDGDSKRKRIDLEEFHERSEAEITILPLNRLVRAKAHKVGTSEALAWDDLTGMRLDGGQVIEARAK